MQKHLEAEAAKTAAVVRDWKGTIAKITTEINIANLARDTARQGREKHALAAAMQDAFAISEIKAARSAETAADQSLTDLAIALPAAEAHLASAEKAAVSARHSLAMLQAEKLMRQRVAAARRMDDALAESAAAYADFERLGRELQSFPDLNFGASGNMSHYEGVTGFRRIASSLPTFFLKLFPGTWTNESARTPLAQSEAHFWQLPEPDKAKAA